jgi:predicted site-specific integrase-resolvase
MIYGYARVSTRGQIEAAQVRQLRAAGAKKVFREVASGAKTDRPQLRRLLADIGSAMIIVEAFEPGCQPRFWTKSPTSPACPSVSSGRCGT